jgi:Flp pilus assembly protein TadG
MPTTAEEFRALLRRFQRSQNGNITVLMTLSMIATTLLCGSAIDYGRLVMARTELAAAVDSAALQAGTSTIADTARLDAMARAMVERNFSQDIHGEIVDFALTRTANEIDLTVTARFETSFMQLAGIDTIDLPVTAEVIRSGNNLEVSLVLDTTGSMRGSKLRSLKTAATEFVNTVVWTNQSQFYSKVALVPYSMGVNLGSRAAAARGNVSSGTCSTPGCQSYRFRNARGANRTLSISNCVSERTGTHAFKDTAASSAPVGRNYASPNNPCLDAELMPLTSNKQDLIDAIDDLDATGSTAGQIGIAWGWYALSRDFGMWSGSSTPAAYNAEKVSKIAVIMTDGEFNTGYCNGVIARNSGNGSGASDDKIDCNATNGSATTQAGQLCTAMKAKDIEVYTIGFDIEDDETAIEIMTDCASSNDHAYLAASDTELQAAFREIGRKVTQLRISK